MANHTAVIVTRNANGTPTRLQEPCDREGLPDAIKRIRAMHPSAFRDGNGLTASFVTLDDRMQLVGAVEPVDVTEYIRAV